LGEDIEFAILRQQLYLHAGPRLTPGLAEQLLLQKAQTPLWCAHQIANRRIGLAHLLQHRFGRNAAVHHPDAPRLAVLALDTIKKAAQGGFVPRDNQGERRATIRMRMAPGVG
jgi:hypothetical protein